jgi:glycosyltransferase involved in cell wall biosynthesis
MYAAETIHTVLSLVSAPDFELVVQDNSDARDLEIHLHEVVADPRLQYQFEPTPLSFVANFERALSLASGKYVCFIGDDDSVNPEIVDATRWADVNGVDALTPSLSATYLWPQLQPLSSCSRRQPANGTLTLWPFSAAVKKVDPEAELRRLVRVGGSGYLQTDIPKLYHGIVRRDVCTAIRERIGYVFGGLSPDIFSAICVAALSQHVISVDYPLTLPGACPVSGSVKSHIGEHVGRLEDAPHLRFRGAYEWARIVPRFYSVETIWADSTVAALTALGRDDLLQDFDTAFLAARCLTAHPKYGGTILRDLYRSFWIMERSRAAGALRLCRALLPDPPWKLAKRAAHRARIALAGDGGTRYTGVSGIAEATHLLAGHLREWNERVCNKPVFLGGLCRLGTPDSEV